MRCAYLPCEDEYALLRRGEHTHATAVPGNSEDRSAAWCATRAPDERETRFEHSEARAPNRIGCACGAPIFGRATSHIFEVSATADPLPASEVRQTSRLLAQRRRVRVSRTSLPLPSPGSAYLYELSGPPAAPTFSRLICTNAHYRPECRKSKATANIARVPTCSAASSTMNSGEWLVGAFRGS